MQSRHCDFRPKTVTRCQKHLMQLWSNGIGENCIVLAQSVLIKIDLDFTAAVDSTTLMTKQIVMKFDSSANSYY